MARKRKKITPNKPQLKVRDLQTKKEPRGGRKAGKGQQEYLVIKMSDVVVSS